MECERETPDAGNPESPVEATFTNAKVENPEETVDDQENPRVPQETGEVFGPPACALLWRLRRYVASRPRYVRHLRSPSLCRGQPRSRMTGRCVLHLRIVRERWEWDQRH
jgi:hypothetical protein